MTDYALEMIDVAVVRRGRTILSVDTLKVQRGQVFALLGANGAGKTTLLTTCLGLCRPQRGQVTVLGNDVVGLGLSALNRLRRRIGYVPQELAARSEMPMTLREVVAIGRTGIAGLFRRLTRDDWRRVDEWIDRLGLGDLRHGAYGELSGGEQRKTLIARAMVQEPAMLILDEPTAHLDLRWREQIVRTLEQLYRDMQVTILLVCHELEVVPACCNALAMLEDGRLTACGSPDEVLSDERVGRLYGPGLQVVHRGRRHAVVPVEGAQR